MLNVCLYLGLSCPQAMQYVEKVHIRLTVIQPSACSGIAGMGRGFPIGLTCLIFESLFQKPLKHKLSIHTYISILQLIGIQCIYKMYIKIPLKQALVVQMIVILGEKKLS